MVRCGLPCSVDRLRTMPSSLAVWRRLFKFTSTKNILVVYRRRCSGHFTSSPLTLTFRNQNMRVNCFIAQFQRPRASARQIREISGGCEPREGGFGRQAAPTSSTCNAAFKTGGNFGRLPTSGLFNWLHLCQLWTVGCRSSMCFEVCVIVLNVYEVVNRVWIHCIHFFLIKLVLFFKSHKCCHESLWRKIVDIYISPSQCKTTSP